MQKPVTDVLAEYLSSRLKMPIPEEVSSRARLHVLDTFGAMLSGSTLVPGRLGASFVADSTGNPESTVIANGSRVPAASAAFANGMAAHADETDDSHAPSGTHPGCAVIPAAFAVAERNNRSGGEMLGAVVAGYDVCGRMSRALGLDVDDSARPSSLSAHSIGGLFGAAAAATILEGHSADRVASVLSYAAQMTSGITTWLRGSDHVDKAFVFAGKPAWLGVSAATMVTSGFRGVPRVFDDEPNFFAALTSKPRRAVLVENLGSDFVICETNIKKFAVGSPAQAAIQAVLDILSKNEVSTEDIEKVTIRLPAEHAYVVDNREMPDINVQYLVAGTLIDGKFSFRMAHDVPRMRDPKIVELTERCILAADPLLNGKRQAEVILHMRGGQELRQHVAAVQGTAELPMTDEEVINKVVALLENEPDRDRLIGAILQMSELDDVATLFSSIRAQP